MAGFFLEEQCPFYSPYQFSGNRLMDMVVLEGLDPIDPREFKKDATTLIIVVQGIGGKPPANINQAGKYKDNSLIGRYLTALDEFEVASATNDKLNVITFASVKGNQTKEDIALTIMRFNHSTEVKGKIVLMGRSKGTDNILELFESNINLSADLVMTLDIMDSRIGNNDTNNVFGNIKKIINYHQTGELFKGATIDSWDISGGTNVVNKEALGSNHRSIDSDLIKTVAKDISNFIRGKDFMKVAKERKIEKAERANYNGHN